MWENNKVSVVLPCYNEEKSIRNTIDEFLRLKVVDEVIAVDNNSNDNTAREIKKTKARYVLESKQGYGHALQRGMNEAKGDYIVTCEPDGTFDAKDIYKFLQYTDDADVIFGTRTSKALIWTNAKMNWFLRLGNEFVAKFLEYMHNGPCLTDVGCTFKLIKKRSYLKIKRKFRTGGSHFSPEFMILAIKKKLNCLEIPVNYKARVGESKITSTNWKAFRLGLLMIWLIIVYRFRRV